MNICYKEVYTAPANLIPCALRELVKGIYMDASGKSSGQRKQGIRAECDAACVNELMQTEQA